MAMQNKQTTEALSGLRLPEQFGCYLRWPVDGTDWIHPEDVELCKRLIPGNRVFQKQIEDQTYNRLVYGEHSIRVKPTLWLEVPVDGYLIGDRVEIRSRIGKRRPAIGTINDIFFNTRRKAVEYKLVVNGKMLPESYYFEDIQPAFELGKPLDSRQRTLMEKSRMS